MAKPGLPYSIACELAMGFLTQAIEERLALEKPDSKLTAEQLVDVFARNLKQCLSSGDSNVDSVVKH